MNDAQGILRTKILVMHGIFSGYRFGLTLLMMIGSWVDLFSQSDNGWKVEDCNSTVREELGARSQLISSSEIASFCDCMAGKWEEMLDPFSLSRMRIRIADECVSAWPDGVVLSWRNSDQEFVAYPYT